MEGRGKNLFHKEHHEDEYNQEDNTKMPSDNTEPKEKDIADALKNKSFMKMMQVILEREKETIFLDLAKWGAKLRTNFDVETIVMKEE